MPPNSADAGKLPEPSAEQDLGGGPETVAGSAMPIQTPMPVGQLSPLESAALEAFPYALLLAYYRHSRRPRGSGEDRGPVGGLAALAGASGVGAPLDLEQGAALQDGADLQAYSVEAAGHLCLYAAVSEGEFRPPRPRPQQPPG